MKKLVLAIPTYNRPDRIGILLDCLENQTDTDFTAVILNDGAHPETARQLQNRMTHFALCSLETPQPSGLPLARNTILDFLETDGLADATAYVAFLDDDLVLEKDFIATVKKYMGQFDGFCFHMVQTGPSTTFSLTQQTLLQKIFSPLIGKVVPVLGIIFGGFYIKTGRIIPVDHLIGCCIIYDFSKNRQARFDLRLNEGNFVAEDTCFTHTLKRNGSDLYYIGTYTFIHDSAPTGGCRIEMKTKSFFWYWKHKLYIFRKLYSPTIYTSAVLFCFLESLLLTVLFRKNLVKEFFLAFQYRKTVLERTAPL